MVNIVEKKNSEGLSESSGRPMGSVLESLGRPRGRLGRLWGALQSRPISYVFLLSKFLGAAVLVCH